MRSESSFGIIPLRKQEGEWQVLLIQHLKGKYWSFPKGHGEPNEEPQDTAQRELREETGLSVIRFISPTPLSEIYIFTRDSKTIHKTVHYFLAEVDGKIALQSSEILASRWVALSEAANIITFPESKEVLKKAREIVK